MSEWANLLPELLGEILQRLPVIDLLAVRAVCASWSRAAAAAHPKPDAPWLMLPGTTDGTTHGATAKFFSLSGSRALSARLPDPPIRSRLVIGSDYGWLITADEYCDMHLLPPVSGAQIPLPPVTSLPFTKQTPCNARQLAIGTLYEPAMLDSTRCRFFRKAVLAPAPRPDGYTVMLLIDSATSKLAFARDGDEAWTCLATTGLRDVADVIFREGCFYTASTDGTVVAWKPNGRSFAPWLGTARLPTSLLLGSRWTVMWFRLYLAESPAGDLIAVLRFLKYPLNPAGAHQTFVFEVHVLDEQESRWVSQRDIGAAALFVGANRTLCVSTEEHPEVEANSIYFTDDSLGFRSWIQWCDPCDMGVFHLRSASVSPIRGLDRIVWPPPVWFTPSMQ